MKSKKPKNPVWIVGVGISTYMDGRPMPDFECGHEHRTEIGAEKCQKKLLHYRREFGKQVCSARWYNSFIYQEG